jgi:signal transduction histidine kinase
LVGFAEILNQQYFGKMNDKQLEYTYGMIEAGQRLINLVDDILDLSSIEAGYMNLSLNQLDVRELLDAIAAITEEWIRREGLKLTISCPRTVGTIIADERRLKQAILNLISNAITYSDGAGTITLFASRLQDHMEIGVMDEGIGILDQDLERVFSPFERGENAKTNDQTGAGLGLSLVKSIIHLHHGDVKIEQIRDPATNALKGTRVSCLLPL